MKVSTFTSVRSDPVQIETTWDEFCTRVESSPTYINKEACPLVKLATFGSLRSAGGLLRNDANTDEVWGIEGDYDAELVSIDVAATLLSARGIDALLYTTPSHTPSAPRWRVLAPLSKVGGASDRHWWLGVLNAAVGGILASESFVLSQSYFLGKVPGGAFRFIRTRGAAIDVAGVAIPPVFPASRAVARTTSNDPFKAVRISEVTSERLAELQSALMGMSLERADVRVKWVQVLHWIADLKGSEWEDEADRLAETFSRRSTKFDEVNFQTVWGSIGSTSAPFETIFKEAAVDGWKNPRKGVKQVPLPPPRVPPLPGQRGPFDEIHFSGVLRTPDWVVPDLIEEGVVTISGKGGVGKTSALVPLALGVAGIISGPERFTVGDRWRHVVYMPEDTRQIERILSAMSVDPNGRFHVVPALRLSISELPTAREAWKRWERVVDGVVLAPLVVFDTKAACFHLEDENDNAEASRLLAALKQDLRMPVWLVTHTSKGDAEGASRGASAIDYDAQQCMTIESRADGRYLVRGKTRFETDVEAVHLTCHKAMLPHVDRWGDVKDRPVIWSSPKAQTAQEAEADLEAKVMQVLRDHPMPTKTELASLMGKRRCNVASFVDDMVMRRIIEIGPDKRIHPYFGSKL